MATVEPGTGRIIRPLSKLQFRWRYTLAEQVAITRAESEHEDPDVRATLAILRMSLAEADFVDVLDARVQDGVAFHALVGLIGAERVAQILAAP